ncbi:glycosyltransferase involved in cell wall biosynthesis [Bradyrhizobium diazoefficiens]
MRIAQLAPLAESVPPKLYGGTERVIAWLMDELVELGHDVTLFASGDSKTKGKLHPVWPRALRLGRRGADPSAACALLIEAIAERASDFDVIHSHVDWLPLPVLSRTGVPFLTTMHGRLDLPGLSKVIGAFPNAGFVSISDNQRRPLPDANWIATIQHGMPRTCFGPLTTMVRTWLFSGG